MANAAVVDRAAMTARLGNAEYALRRVADDEIEVRAGDVFVGAFTCSHAESGVRLRGGASEDDAAAALHAIARGWLETEVQRALVREPMAVVGRSDDEARDAADAGNDEDVRRRDSGSRARVGSVLLVTEEAAFRSFLALALRRRGYEVECVGSAEASRALVTRRFGVVVAAAVLGDGAGIDLLAWFKLRTGARTVALVDAVPAVAGRAAGVDAYLQVPCHVVAIVQAIERLASPAEGASSA